MRSRAEPQVIVHVASIARRAKSLRRLDSRSEASGSAELNLSSTLCYPLCPKQTPEAVAVETQLIVPDGSKAKAKANMHANQHRSACETCRRHKLRCVRPEPSAPACHRCMRLELPCTTGSTRRIGRPTRAAIVRSRSPGPLPLWMSNGFDWLGNDCVIDTPTITFINVPSGPRMPDTALQTSTLTKPENAFASLTTLNSRLRAVNESLGPSSPLEDYVYGIIYTFDGRTQNAIQTMLSSLQAFIQIIRVLAKQSMLNSFLPPEYEQNHTNPATLFLVASCLSQLLLYFERTYTALNTRLDDFMVPMPPPSDETSFAHVPVQNFASQCAMFNGLSRNLLKQMLVDLGIPGPGTSLTGSFRPGLCDTDDRLKDMVNAELGHVEGDWSVRPRLVLELLDLADELVLTRAMEDGWQ
ncbi:uncharacterized protein F5Z01DRAFT_649497 [Emericellopsis atlantica]|uniref:Zn(2)-C6 fungal-type domain-containing protein n=1 Tax=Emericellopsis atlantica TaxID=2614577 RepID=A0A9P7ZQ24_9HYPO|nr:uncharacterized protein F5Z01DRAFT_649497 [Emericellopsis atlantica]KAG9256224.1 hypothetical protein F5Z01DRAFT_649497 [Emericellopsis atlantica]